MKLVLNKIQQGPVLAKGEDSAGKACGYNGIDVGDGCVELDGSLKNGGSGTITYSQPCSC